MVGQSDKKWHPNINLKIVSTKKTITDSLGELHLVGQLEMPFVHNAATSPSDYGGTNWRCLEELYALMGSDFRKSIQSLKPESTILLPGGGYAVYGIELAKKGHLAISLNAQNFYFEGPFATVSQDYEDSIFDQQSRSIFSIGKIRVNVLNRLARALEVPLPKGIRKPKVINTFVPSWEYWTLKPGLPFDVFYLEAMQFIRAIQNRFKGASHFKGTFLLRKTLVQQGLPLLADNAFDLVIDVLDAFTYSSDCQSLLTSYYSKLRNGGQAFIFLDGTLDRVKLTKPESISEFSGMEVDGWVSLADYLAKRFPDVFSVSRSIRKFPKNTLDPQFASKECTVTVLRMSRGASGLENLFFQGLKMGNTWVRDRGGSQKYPIVEFLEQG